jgi:hypothetical protein
LQGFPEEKDAEDCGDRELEAGAIDEQGVPSENCS